MIRKFAVLAIAVAAVGFVVSSAEAGGTSGAKKSFNGFINAMAASVQALRQLSFPIAPAARSAMSAKLWVLPKM